MVPLKYVSNFRRTLEISLINCEINLILTWSVNCLLVAGTVANQAPIFTVTDTKLHVPLVTLSTQDNAKLFQETNSGFKRTIIWNKYQSKITTQAWNQHSDHLIDLSFQGVNSLFVRSYGNIRHWASYKRYFLPTIEIKDYNRRNESYDQWKKFFWSASKK